MKAIQTIQDGRWVNLIELEKFIYMRQDYAQGVLDVLRSVHPENRYRLHITVKRQLRQRLFTLEQVREIRGLYNRREMTGRALALRYDVYYNTIMSMIHHRTYVDIK